MDKPAKSQRRKSWVIQCLAVDGGRLSAIAVCLFGLNLVLLAWTGPFVKQISIIHVLIAIIAGIQGLLAAVLYTLRGYSLRDAPAAVFLFYFLLIPGYSLWVGYPIQDIIRSTVPFLFFPIAYFSVVTWNSSQLRLAILFLTTLSVLISLEVIPFLIGKMTQTDAIYYRLTAYSANAHLPYYIAALAFVGGSINQRLLRVLVYSILLLAILFTKSKGQLGAALFVLISLSILRWRNIQGRWMFATDWKEFGSVVLIVSVMFFGVNFLSSTNIFQGGKIEWSKLFEMDVWTLGMERYSVENFQGETTRFRMLELEEATRLFLDNPVLGVGPGVKFEFESPITKQVVTQRYIHNAPFYFLATGGILGLAVYSLPLIVGMIIAIRKWTDDHIRRITVAITAILLYTLVSANFKSIQVNVLLGLLIGTLTALGESREAALKQK